MSGNVVASAESSADSIREPRALGVDEPMPVGKKLRRPVAAGSRHTTVASDIGPPPAAIRTRGPATRPTRITSPFDVAPAASMMVARIEGRSPSGAIVFNLPLAKKPRDGRQATRTGPRVGASRSLSWNLD